MFLRIYTELLKSFGPQDWWPMNNKFSPPEWEVCVGAILTQNTSWANVEKALTNMKKAGCTSADAVLNTPPAKLEVMVQPSGFYRQKAVRLKSFAKTVKEAGGLEKFLEIPREGLLRLKGIGQETADSVLLYAGERPFFVIDAYTRRVFSRLGMATEDAGYEELRALFEKNIPKNVTLYKEYHALIVELAKRYCRKKNPGCAGCPLLHICFHGPEHLKTKPNLEEEFITVEQLEKNLPAAKADLKINRDICSMCGLCCTRPVVLPEEKKRIMRAAKLGFFQRRMFKYDPAGYYVIEGDTCPFLKPEKGKEHIQPQRWLCSIYDHRPLCCKVHPLVIDTRGKELRWEVSRTCPLWREFSNEEMRKARIMGAALMKGAKAYYAKKAREQAGK